MKNKEIKFRAWDEKRKYMDYVSLAEADGSIDLRWMQYTGLKDKNGKEIYEGDILNSKNDGKDGCDIWDYLDQRNIVVESYDPFRMRVFKGYDELFMKSSVYHIERIEVIGNIFENKGLINE